MNENKVKINAIPIDFIKTKIEENRTSLYAESLNLLLREWADRKEEMSELIRCKDCKYNNGGRCSWHGGAGYKWIVDDKDYCSCAERKEE